MILLYNPTFKGAEIVGAGAGGDRQDPEGWRGPEGAEPRQDLPAGRDDPAAAELHAARPAAGPVRTAGRQPRFPQHGNGVLPGGHARRRCRPRPGSTVFPRGASSWRSSPRRRRRSRRNDKSEAHTDCTGGRHDTVRAEDRPHQAARDRALCRPSSCRPSSRPRFRTACAWCWWKTAASRW